MFWGSYTWYQKDPCHIWRKETKAERALNDEYLAQLNTILEATGKGGMGAKFGYGASPTYA